MPQLVGKKCFRCGKTVDSITEGCFCEACSSPYHHRCPRPAADPADATRCPVCGGARAERPDPASQEDPVTLMPEGAREAGMTEKERWLSSEDPEWLLRFLIDDDDPRRFRLLAAALLRCPHPRQELGGRPLTEREWEQHSRHVERIEELADHWESRRTDEELPLDCTSGVMALGLAPHRGVLHGTTPEERRLEATLIRDVFHGLVWYGPPPFPTYEAPWPALVGSPEVDRVALATYERHDPRTGHLAPGLLAVLSDALEGAGCTDAALLSHLRSPGPHVRGCWALDLVLGKQ